MLGWRQRVGTKQEAGRSTSALWRCVKTHALSLQFPAIKSFVHLSTTHVRAIVNLPPDKQEMLLTCAEAERWTAVRLERAAAELRYATPEEPQRARESRFFERPGADLLRNLTTSLGHLKRAQGRMRQGLPSQVQKGIDLKLAQLREVLSALSDGTSAAADNLNEGNEEESAPVSERMTVYRDAVKMSPAIESVLPSGPQATPSPPAEQSPGNGAPMECGAYYRDGPPWYLKGRLGSIYVFRDVLNDTSRKQLMSFEKPFNP